MITNILLGLILFMLWVSILQRGHYARKQTKERIAHTDSMDDLTRTLNTFIDEIRSVQTYGLRLQK